MPSDTKDKWDDASEGCQKLLSQPHIVRDAVARLTFTLRCYVVDFGKHSQASVIWQTESDL